MRYLTALGAFSVLLVASTGTAAATTPTPFNTNLVKNGGAENPVAGDPNTGAVIPGWHKTHNFTVVSYGAGSSFPSVAEGKRISGGKQFFSSGMSSGGECGFAYQDIKLVGRNSLIDTGHLKVVVKARMATYDSETDTAELDVTFLDNSDHYEGDAGPFQVTGTAGKFQLVSQTLVVPFSTRDIQITLVGQNLQGPYCNAYFDKVSVKISSF